MKKYRIHFSSGASLDIEADEVKHEGGIVSFRTDGELIDSFFATDARRIDTVAELPATKVELPPPTAVPTPVAVDVLPFSKLPLDSAPAAVLAAHRAAALTPEQANHELALLGIAPPAPVSVLDPPVRLAAVAVVTSFPLLPFSHVDPARVADVKALLAIHRAHALTDEQSAAEVRIYERIATAHTQR